MKLQKTEAAVLLLAVLANLAFWIVLNRPEKAPSWRGVIRGVSFSPFQAGQDPAKKSFPSPGEISGDLKLLRGVAASVRTYSSTQGQESIPALAAQQGLRVTAGAWLDRDEARNRAEIANLITNARRHANVDRVIVGNEAVLRGDLSPAQLARYLRQVRSAVRAPVSTAEPWHVWIAHPELASEVDFITVHLLPYWEGIPGNQALDWAMDCLRRVQESFPGKPVLIGEIGWPSGGGHWDKASAGLVNQARFVRAFLNLAQEKNLDYFIIEAFDQPWKSRAEGAVGGHWGLFDVHREPKFSMVGDLVPAPFWPVECFTAILLAAVAGAFFLDHWDNLRGRGQLFYALLLQGVASVAVWTVCLPMHIDLSTGGKVLWGLLLPAQAGIFVLVLTNGLEMTELLWIRRWKRRFLPLLPSKADPFPKVSLHLAICNEPPDLVIQTLNALARLDYPRFEVLIVDNNTTSDELWLPVQAHCASLGSRFSFFHLPKWPGYKAGALNFALSRTDPSAQIVGVIDSDYQVSPDWLRSLVPYFGERTIGFVQAPQDNRHWQGNPFKEMINWEYKGFFEIGMVHRNERNAIIQHGTMTLIRKSALLETGAWGEWCICEDAELGLRLMQAGYDSVYVNHNFGEGVTPDSFAGYKGQRFRWTYGAVQILRRHWRLLLPWSPSPLTAGQRYHFAAGWFPWFTDALHLVFTFVGIFWSVGMLLLPAWFEFPLAVLLLPTLGLFAFKVLHALVLYRARVECTTAQALGAAVAGMGLTHTVARAVFAGLFTSGRPFLRTPKGENRPALIKGFLMAREETQILLLLAISILAVLVRYGDIRPEASWWALLLMVQALPYAAALLTSMASTLPGLRPLGIRYGYGYLLVRRWRRQLEFARTNPLARAASIFLPKKGGV